MRVGGNKKATESLIRVPNLLIIPKTFLRCSSQHCFSKSYTDFDLCFDTSYQFILESEWMI